MANPDRVYGLNPADFGTTGLTLGLLIGIVHNEPQLVMPRGHVHAQGPETKQAWRIRAVQQVLRDHGVDLDIRVGDQSGPASAPNPSGGES